MTICPLVSLKMEQEKKGLISTGWLSSKKGKFSKVLHCQLGKRRQRSAARDRAVALPGLGSSRLTSRPIQGTWQEQKYPGELRVKEVCRRWVRAGSGDQEQGTKVRNQAKGSITERTQKLRVWPGRSRSRWEAKWECWEGMRLKIRQLRSKYASDYLTELPGAPSAHP